MQGKRIIRTVSVFGLACASLLPLAGQSAAQQFFSSRQIINQLQVAPGTFQQGGNQNVRMHRVPQPVNQPRLKRRAPQPQGGGHVIMRRAPQPQGGGQVVMRRAPQPEHQPIIRAPQPEQGFREFRAPPPSGGQVARRRAPQPQNVSPSRAPRPEPVDVASNGQRGLEVRPTRHDRVAEDYPATGRIDLEILFDYDSDRISPKSVKQLVELGDALNDPELGARQFMVAGHTDAAGSHGYNADLSLRRARAVTEFLVNFAGVESNRLVIEGYGESLLKYPDAPESGQNRRVEIINLGESG